MVNDFIARTERILGRINELASISEDRNGITRTYGSGAFIEGRTKVLGWMKEAGLQTRTDNIGNARGKLYCKDAAAKTLVIASHIDTVRNAGRFDGPLGVLMGLDLLEQLVQTQSDVPFHIELIAFCDEEGVRFHTTYLGSKAVAGTFDANTLARKDDSGKELREVIRAMGGNIQNLAEDAIAPGDWLSYFEIHIEQGPVLYEEKIPAAVVSAIAGQRRIEVTVSGEPGHAGTVPMDKRRDALCGASEFIVETERLALEHKDKLVATVGRLNITDSASNVIPGEVAFSVDVRSADGTFLEDAYRLLQKVGTGICEKRRLHFDWNLVQKTDPLTCNPQLSGLLAHAVEEAGYKAVSLVSGAGHDAVAIAPVAPVAMLFVRCYKGISHNPLEDVAPDDIAAAVQIADNFIQHLIKQNQ